MGWRREKLGIGTEDEDIGDETEETSVVDLTQDMTERLRVDLAVWKSRVTLPLTRSSDVMTGLVPGLWAAGPSRCAPGKSSANWGVNFLL